jgi:hypothetical protein
MKKERSQKELAFGTGLLEPTLTGKKQITMRKFRPEAHLFLAGDIFIGKFADGMDVPLQTTADTEVKIVAEITDEEAQADGFNDADDAYLGLKSYYPDLTPDSQLGIIRFTLLENKP